MSFVKKALKKVVKTVKKVVKTKVFKYVAIAAAVFFTAGVVAGGFASFSGVTSIGGFFGAVGETIAAGASAITGALGMSGLSTSLAGYGGAAAQAAGLGAFAPAAVTGLALPAGATSLASAQFAGSAASRGGFLAGVGRFLGGTAGATSGASTGGALWTSVALGALNGVIASKANKKEYPNGYVAGGRARGDSATPPPAYTFDFGTPAAAQTPTVAAQLAKEAPALMQAPQPLGLVADAGQKPSSFAPTVNEGVQRIRDRLARRDEQQAAASPYETQLAQSEQSGSFGPFDEEATRISLLQRGA